MAAEEKREKSLADYAKRMGIEVGALREGMKKYGLSEADLTNQVKRDLLRQAIDSKWARDEFKGAYDRTVPDSADWDWDEIITSYGYSLGVLREYGDQLRPIFKWLAGQLQRGESLENLKNEFDKRVSQTEFGDRTSTEIQADLERYGASKKDFRDRLRDLTRDVQRLAVRAYGEGMKDNLDEGIARQVALDLIYQERGFLTGSFDDEVVKRYLQPYVQKNREDPTDPVAPPDLTGDEGAYRSTLMSWLSRNGVVLLEDRIDYYIDALDKGTMDMNSIKQDIRNKDFTRKYSAYADLFAQGQDVADIALDFRQTAANLLEKPLESVAIDDELVKRALEYKGPDGKPAQMAGWEFEQVVRKTPEWDKTNNAMTAYTDIGETILRNFGFRG